MTSRLEIRTERLSAGHDKSGFACENEPLTEYLHRYASQDERKDVAACYVALEADAMRVLGYYTLSAHAVLRAELSDEHVRGLPRYDRYPAYIIGRLARDLSMKGRGLGELLLLDAFARLSALDAAGRMIVVDPIDGNARTFYERFGFTSFGNDKARLLLPMSAARKSLA